MVLVEGIVIGCLIILSLGLLFNFVHARTNEETGEKEKLTNKDKWIVGISSTSLIIVLLSDAFGWLKKLKKLVLKQFEKDDTPPTPPPAP